MAKLTEKGQKTKKFIINTLIFVAIVGGVYLAWPYISGKDSNGGGGMKIGGSANKADITLAYNTFPGMQGILLMNGGMEPNSESELYKKYGVKLRIKQMDVVANTRSGLHSGDLDMVYCTTDALPIEMGSGSGMVEDKVVQILQVNQSRGADALVVRPGIEQVTDLKGRTVAVAIGTASHTFLLELLETSNMENEDITVYKVSDGIEAAQAFKSGQCDAALVWAPDDEDCVQAVKGSKILVSTATATNIIADGLLVREAVLNEKREDIMNVCRAWLEGNARLNSSESDRVTANKLFAEGFDFPEDIAAISTGKIRFSTLGDNKNFFGLNSGFSGMTGEKMYTRMAVKYTKLGYVNGPKPWRSVSDPSIIEELMNDSEFANSNAQAADEKKAFTPATAEERSAKAKSSKIVTLEFDLNSASLDQLDKDIINREISSLAQAFGGARIRVEGNTDNSGTASLNKRLSLQRAQAVVDYMIREHQFDANRFIVVGNGPNKPVTGCEGNQSEACRAKNRRTEFQFIWN